LAGFEAADCISVSSGLTGSNMAQALSSRFSLTA
jgi:hypothetical protein